MPKIVAPAWMEKASGPNPLFGQSTGPFAEIILGDIIGLQQFGVRLERLHPGSRSSYRHWHEKEDEFVYVLSGELTLVEEQESTLRAGDAPASQHRSCRAAQVGKGSSSSRMLRCGSPASDFTVV